VTKIIRESGINYTFLETMSMDTNPESKSDADNIDSKVEKDVLKKRSIESKNQKFDIKTEYLVDKINKAIPPCTNSFTSIVSL
jgi:hypothetical protein